MLVRPLPLHVHRVPQVLPGVPLLCRRDHQSGTRAIQTAPRAISTSRSRSPVAAQHGLVGLPRPPLPATLISCRPHLRQVNENKLIVKGKLDVEDVQLNKGAAGPVPATMARVTE